MGAKSLIVIGASAGGIEALTRVVSGLPADLPAAICVVVHVPSYSTSQLPKILSRAGRLPAQHARSQQPLEPGCIYVAPPDYHLLAVGERLFEIAPLERMVVEVAVPEADVPWVKEGQTVEIVLDAWPETTWTGQLSRVHPRAEIRDEEHVFIAEVLLENPEALLRPGMRGRAKIEGPAKPLGWNLFHKPWYELRYWLGW